MWRYSQQGVIHSGKGRGKAVYQDQTDKKKKKEEEEEGTQNNRLASLAFLSFLPFPGCSSVCVLLLLCLNMQSNGCDWNYARQTSKLVLNTTTGLSHSIPQYSFPSSPSVFTSWNFIMQILVEDTKIGCSSPSLWSLSSLFISSNTGLLSLVSCLGGVEDKWRFLEAKGVSEGEGFPGPCTPL